MSPMMEFYPQVKWTHVHAVLCSGAFFALRGGASLLGARWPRHWLPKYASYAIDTVLLTSATMLFSMLPGALFANGWLALKLALLVVYVAFGVLAMRERRSRAQRAAFFVAALATFTVMFGIARMHHPAGWLLPLLG
ncbi:SirB2 family protein [Thermomonas sp.]|uniref:SirB2 family protein n=1 Tax=Thermomonas sp. TaxID=1971895 RepID=UPI0035AE9749